MKKLLIVLCVFLFTGCYNYTELNEIDIVTGIAIDKTSDEYKISYVISNSQKPESSTETGSAKVTILTGHGKNISDAKLDLQLKNPKKTYFGHVSVYVISEEVAKDSVYSVIDTILRNPESMQKFYLIVAKDCKAIDIVKTISPLESFSSDNISSNIENTNKEQGFGISVKLSDFVNNILRDGITPYLPTVTLEGKNDGAISQEELQKTEVTTYASISSMALFDNYKMVHYTTRDESRGINILNNRVEILSLSSKIHDETISVKFNNVASKIKLSFKDNQPIFNIHVQASGSIDEIGGKFDLTHESIIKEIEDVYNKKITKIVNKSIALMKDLNLDPVGFGNMIYSNKPCLYQSIKDSYLGDLNVKIHVETNIKAKGTLANTLKEAKKWN